MSVGDLTFIKKYVIIKKTAFLPIGHLTYIKKYVIILSGEAYDRSVLAFRENIGAYGISLSTEKNCIWGVPIGKSVLGARPRPVHLFEGAYGVAFRSDDFGKPNKCSFTKNLQKIFTK